MNSKPENSSALFHGYVNTSLLWNHDIVFGLKQFDPQTNPNLTYSETLANNIRLGKHVEQFVSYALRQNKNIKVYRENIQVKDGKITIGELDCLLMHNGSPIHLEVIYKFYLYDPDHGASELDHWIGPNRNDSLIQKLNKLKNKQLPLLFNKHTRPLLTELGLDRNKIEQRVHFKAQLFLPLNSTSVQFELLNRSCLSGYYIHLQDTDQIKNCMFYIPTKLNWLMDIQKNVDWKNFTIFQQELGQFLNQKRSPLCWIKYPDGKMQKLFVVWWK
ncbi:DUF1853 family protein [Lutimonas zeaxanthinifaciens]|uniref:DUF1853 family protein n=1 Tax=Lutimonas zeaxanthinifaciens TaxID=3060215 RepID=UPI00265CB43B|nr:DUF1853 family protein [Lutimonas sp. YSD2104]WKK64585.1 DUF1853 family protein [Lutimonas sp. YSD2104]